MYTSPNSSKLTYFSTHIIETYLPFYIFHKSVNIRRNAKTSWDIPIGARGSRGFVFNYGTRYYLTLFFYSTWMKGKTCKISHTKGDKEYKSPPITWYFLSNESFLAASSPPNYYQGVYKQAKNDWNSLRKIAKHLMRNVVLMWTFFQIKEGVKIEVKLVASSSTNLHGCSTGRKLLSRFSMADWRRVGV